MANTESIVSMAILLVIVGALFVPLVDTVDSRTGEQSVTNETVTASTGEYVQLENYELVDGSVTVYNSTDDVQTEGTDYEVGYENGSIKALSGGGITDGNTIKVTYDYQATSGVVTTIAELVPLMVLVAILGTLGLKVRQEVSRV